MRLLPAFLVLLACGASLAQGADPNVSVSLKLAPSDARAGEGAQVVATFKVKEGWHCYAPSRQGDFVEISVAPAEGEKAFKASGALIEPPLPVKMVQGFNVPGAYVMGEASFGLPVSVSSSAPSKGTAKFEVQYQACTEASCDMPQTVHLSLPYSLGTGPARSDRMEAVKSVPMQPAGYVAPKDGEGPQSGGGKAPEAKDETRLQIEKAKKDGPLAFMLLAFLLGLGALATPCVWPMIPITVSFFSKKTDKGRSNLTGALAYALGIMTTFTGIGVVVSVIFGSTGVQLLSANPWLNLGLAILFVALALNLFGVYEIMVPSSVVNALNKKGGKGSGILGPVFMGLAFSLTSFTCTVPFAGTVLASAAGGDYFYPVLGMLSFSFAFALPFFLLALFPQFLTSLPKSGSWLVSVKAYLGFLEIAFALKFLSNTDLVFGLGLLTREAFLAVWACVLTIASVYVLGWLKLAKEGEVKVGWPRAAFGVANLAIVGYLVAGVQGAPMGVVTAFLPPAPYPGRAEKAGDLEWHDTIDKAVAEAKSGSKNIFIDFTGVTCSNCRVMESEVFTLPTVKQELGRFSRAKLFTDRNTASDNANADLRIRLTQSATNPVYVVLTPDRKVLRVFQGLGAPQDFLKFLKGGGGPVALR